MRLLASLIAAIGIAAALALPARADNAGDQRLCDGNGPDFDARIAACTRRISGHLPPRDLAFTYHNRGIARAAKGDADGAIADYNEALRLDPKYTQAYNARGFVKQRKGDLDGAIADFDAAIRANPKSVISYNGRANVKREKSDFEGAITDYGVAIRLDPRFVFAYRGRALARQRKNDLDGALADNDAAIRLDPKFAHTYLNRGHVRMLKGHLDAALADYNTAIQLDAKVPVAYNGRGVVLQKKGDLDGALADYNAALQLDAKISFVYFNRAFVRQKKGDLDGAIADYEQAIQIDPVYTAAYTKRGLAYEEKNDLVHARADFDAALAVPEMYDNGKWAHETAQSHLAALSGDAAKSSIAAAPLGKRVALVIGNSAYVNVPRLTNPTNDARLMADTLRALGFTLVGGGAQLDLDKTHFDRAVQSFGDQLQGADVALFYYAGHGMQLRGANYLVPISANPTREADVDFQMLDSNLVLRQMEAAGTKLNLVVLDACRNNPFGGRGLRATDGGLAQMRAPEGTLVSFATQPGAVAQDGLGGNSPYTKALVATMRKPGLDVFKTFNEVGLAVSSATGGAQQPWLSVSPIKGDFYFGGAPAGAKS